MSEQCLGSLGKIRSIPNKAKVLQYPTDLFFENRAGLAAKFGAFLDKNVIPRQPMVQRAFLAAGVRPLGTAVEVELLQSENPDNDP